MNWMLNSDGSLSDNFLNESSPFYSGDIKLSASPNPPSSFWLICNGQAVLRSAYPSLFAAIGTTYGPGDSSTTFNLPDLQDNFPVGVSGTKTLGSTGGSDTITPTAAQLPAHSHNFQLYTDTAGPDVIQSLSLQSNGSGQQTQSTEVDGGSGDPITITPPYVALYYYIRT